MGIEDIQLEFGLITNSLSLGRIFLLDQFGLFLRLSFLHNVIFSLRRDRANSGGLQILAVQFGGLPLWRRLLAVVGDAIFIDPSINGRCRGSVGSE